MRKLSLTTLACAAALGLGLAAIPPTVLAQTAATAATTATAPAAPELQRALRALWQGHIVTTRDYALAVFAAQPDQAQQAADAVVANATDISQAVAGFYGAAAGDGLLQLLAGHWNGVKALTDSAQAGDTAGEDQAMDALGRNAGEIASFLAGANPHWKEAELQAALIMHGGHHRQQVDLMAAKAPQAEQDSAWREMQHHMDMIADVLADGIARQFPDKAS